MRLVGIDFGVGGGVMTVSRWECVYCQITVSSDARFCWRCGGTVYRPIMEGRVDGFCPACNGIGEYVPVTHSCGREAQPTAQPMMEEQ